VLSNDGGLDELRAASSEYLKTSTNWINEVFSYTTWRLAVLFSIVFALIFTAIMSSLVMYSKNICNEQLILAVFLVMSIGMILCTYVSLNFFGRHIVKPAEDISE
jgi:archaellum biogenesis protein FlaJ (TadC family)